MDREGRDKLTLNIHLSGALTWYDAGMSVVAVRDDGSKRPQFDSWKGLQLRRASRSLVEKWFTGNPTWGVGLICGKISGGLEMTEIEAARSGTEFLDLIDGAVRRHGVLDVWDMLQDKGYCEVTPSGGFHFLYRIADEVVPGNTKIAMSADSKVTYAETRGEGGFVATAPSHGTVHPSGDSWSVISGQLGVVPTITWEQRCALHAAIKEALDERTLPEYTRPAGIGAYDRSQGDRPGDAFNDDPTVSIGDILTRNGWKFLKAGAGQEFFVHPMSSDMTTHSAATGHRGSPNLYAWSGMPREDYFDKFAVLTHLEFNGDFSAAGRYLRGQGYGTPPVASGGLDISDWFEGGETVTPEAAPEPAKAAPRIEQFTEKGVGRYAGALFGDRVRYVSEERGWRLYENGAWVKDKTRTIGRIAEKVSDHVDASVAKIFERATEMSQSGHPEGKERLEEAKKLKTFAKSVASDKGLRAVQNRLSDQPGVGVAVESFDAEMNLLCLDNGTFDLKNMALRPHSPKDMLTKRIGVSYDPDATAPRWSKYLEEVLPDRSYREYLQRAVGMALLGDTTEGAFFVLHGETGCGKSQFIKVMNAVMGDYAKTAAASTFVSPRNGGTDSRRSNDLHELRGSRFVSTSETSETTVLNEELIKRITGDDEVTSHAVYESSITWKPQFTMFMATNFRPKLNSNDNATWRRVKPIHFPNTFYKEGELVEGGVRGLGDQLIERELPGILNWVVEGAKDFLEHGLGQPKAMRAELEEYREEVDPVIQFVNESAEEGVLTLGDDQEMSFTQAYAVYVAWARNNNMMPMGKNRFGNRLTGLGYGKRRTTGGVCMRTGLGMNPATWQAAAQKSAWDWK
jgi:putative DNA primase/helicase